MRIRNAMTRMMETCFFLDTTIYRWVDADDKVQETDVILLIAKHFRFECSAFKSTSDLREWNTFSSSAYSLFVFDRLCNVRLNYRCNSSTALC
jgi:hypothetical protein